MVEVEGLMAEHQRNRQVERLGDVTVRPGMIPVVETGLLQSERDEAFVSRPRPIEDWWFGELAKFALRSRYVETGDREKGSIGREAMRQAETYHGA